VSGSVRHWLDALFRVVLRCCVGDRRDGDRRKGEVGNRSARKPFAGLHRG
jgi:hypothetical protein